jgi:hypothetical protein
MVAGVLGVHVLWTVEVEHKIALALTLLQVVAVWIVLDLHNSPATLSLAM